MRKRTTHPMVTAARFFSLPFKFLRDLRYGEVWTFNGEVMAVREDDSNPRRARDVLLYLADIVEVMGLDHYQLRVLAGKLGQDEVEETLLNRVEVVLASAQARMARMKTREIYDVLSRFEQPEIWRVDG